MGKRHKLLKRSIAVKSNGRANVQAVSHGHWQGRGQGNSPAPASGRRAAAPLLLQNIPFAELHKGIYVKDDNQAVQVVLARTSPSGAVELDVRIRPKPG